MNQRLAEAVVAAFRLDEPEAARRLFATFRERDWMRTKKWLHASGMALYLLERVTKLGVDDALPVSLIDELSINLAENRVRTADLFEDFSRLNTSLMRAGISYLNLKGFTLSPFAFEDPALRYQLDLDFLVGRNDIERCASVMEANGYMVQATYPETWTFWAGKPAKLSISDLYRVRPMKNIEVHIVPELEEKRGRHGGDRMSRMQLQTLNGLEFPALGDADKLLLQATHLFHHFQGEWTRTSWLLEYANAVRALRGNAAIWREAAEIISAAPEIGTGIGVATMVMSATFGATPPAEFTEQVSGRLTPALRLWIERYRKDLVFTDHPGSKLYLLLRDVVEGENPELLKYRRKRLVPLHLPARVVPKGGATLSMRWRTAAELVKYTSRRLRFHLREGLRYKLEAARWRRFVAGGRL